MVDDRQRIEVLFAETDRTVRIDLEADADPAVVDALAAALEADDPVDAERGLTEYLERGRLPAGG